MNKRMMVCSWLVAHPRLSGLLGGVGLGLPFVWPMYAPIAIPAVLLCILLLERLDQTKLPAVLSSVFGVKALFALSWFLSAYPITWLFELAPSTQLIVVCIYWGICAVFLSSAGIVLALLWRWCRYFAGRVYLLPVLWVVAEYLGAVIFSIFSAGPGSYVTGAFSFGHIGYLFPLLAPVAIFGGVYAIGLFSLFGITILYQSLVTKRWRIGIGTAVFLGLLFVVAVESMTVSYPTGRILFINTAFPSEVADADRTIALREMVESSLGLGGDYILLPEDARYLYQYELPIVGAKEAIEAWQILHASNTATIIDSGRVVDVRTGKVVQRAFVWNDTSDIYQADKQYLVPQGEFMPSLAVFALRFVGLGPVATALSDTINYTSSRQLIAAEAGQEIPNILFCFESVSPLAAKRLVANRPSDFIVHPMSHAWFHSPEVVWRQLDVMLRYQAVYARTPIVSVGNEIRGKVYLPDGTMTVPQTVAHHPFGTIDVYESEQ